MSLAPGSSKFTLWSENIFSSATQWVQALISGNRFTPEETLAEAKNVDPRLVPKVPMQSTDIDTNLLLELSKLGMKHGKLVTAASHPELMQSWKVMSARAGLPKAPQLIIVESKVINAMTVSPEEVVMTTGLLKKLDLRETCAVLGHELGHAVSDHKRPRMAATALFGGAGAYGGYKAWHAVGKPSFQWKPESRLPAVLELLAVGIGSSLGGIVGNQVSVKPTELQADLKGAAISGDPMGLVSALRKLEAGRKRNPLTNMLAYLHSGYPTTEQRIQNLLTVATQMPVRTLAPEVIVAAQAPTPANQPSPQVSAVAADARLALEAPQYSLN